MTLKENNIHEINQDYLKSILRYDPEIGRFFWIGARQKVTVGNMAGYLRENKYRSIVINGISFLEHRLVWLYSHGIMPKDQIDHINHIRDDNRLENLRIVSHQENQRNRSKSKNNVSGITGISWHKSTGKWQAKIKVDGKMEWIGIFEDYFESICARKSAELKYGFHKNHGRKDDK